MWHQHWSSNSTHAQACMRIGVTGVSSSRFSSNSSCYICIHHHVMILTYIIEISYTIYVLYLCHSYTHLLNVSISPQHQHSTSASTCQYAHQNMYGRLYQSCIRLVHTSIMHESCTYITCNTYRISYHHVSFCFMYIN